MKLSLKEIIGSELLLQNFEKIWRFSSTVFMEKRTDVLEAPAGCYIICEYEKSLYLLAQGSLLNLATGKCPVSQPAIGRGGIIRNHAYLRDFSNILSFDKDGGILENLLIGKTSLDYIQTINDIFQRKLLFSPDYKMIFYASLDLYDSI